jgi:hypothetical protein
MYGNEGFDGKRTRGFCSVRVGRDSGDAPNTQPLMGKRTRMANDIWWTGSLWSKSLEPFSSASEPLGAGRGPQIFGGSGLFPRWRYFSALLSA